MKIIKVLLSITVILALGYATNRAINNSITEKVDTRIDNQGYWTRLAAKGIVPYNPEVRVKSATFTGSKIRAKTVSTLDSPDVPVTEINCIQSENSVFINPLDETNLINSNNSATNPIDTTFGANSFYSNNSGTTWDGDIEGAGEENFGDPAATIGLNGRWYINYINGSSGMGVSYSDDNGESWIVKNASPNPSINCDKNHMWIDNNPDSPYEGNLYVAWTNFSDLALGEIGFSYSTDDGETWNINTDISSEVNAGSHNQGVHISTGPDGEVYAVWAIYDSWPSGGSDESAIGMAKSLDGGVTWEPAKRIITDIRGIRASGTSKNMRVNSFPVSTVDNSNYADRGTIYVTWANKGVPGINNGYDVDVYLIKSIDMGETWSDPLKVNYSVPNEGKQHFMQWITCDPTTGILSMVYYDDRDVIYSSCEVYCANSVDGGENWEEFKVSDVSFTPAPIPGLADSYMGDYLGIHAKNGVVYPVWTDNRLGYAMSFCSPYETSPVNRPIDLMGEVLFDSGEAKLSWTYEEAPGFLGFIVYRDGDSIGSTIDTAFSEMLPEYGLYRYRVTAYYDGDIESGASGISLQWGGVIMNVSPDSITDHIAVGRHSEHELVIVNNGQLNLEYNISLNSTQNKILTYCDASGGSEIGDEYISGVEVGDISNVNTGNDNYTDYSEMETIMKVGNNYDIIVTNGEPYDLDKCGVWIDWNIDGVFDDTELLELNGSPGSPIFSGTIIPPPGSVTGSTKMRVRLTYSGDLSPCGNTFFGEVEDYTVVIHAWMDLSRTQDTVVPQDTSRVWVNFNAVDLPPGDYSTNLMISSNDPLSGIVQIPVSLRVDHLVIDVQAEPDTICSGSLIRVEASVTGSFDSITYSWSSIPVGFTSVKPRPFAIPTVPTWYIVEIQDGDHTATDSVFVYTLPAPEVNLGVDTSYCGSEIIVLDAGDDGDIYLWSTGDITRTIEVDTVNYGFGIQTYSVQVTNLFECTSLREIEIDFVNCTGLYDNAEEVMEVFPVPSSGLINIKLLNNQIQEFNIEVMDSKGTIVYNGDGFELSDANVIPLNLKHLNSGYYTLILNSGSKRYFSRVIIAH